MSSREFQTGVKFGVKMYHVKMLAPCSLFNTKIMLDFQEPKIKAEL